MKLHTTLQHSVKNGDLSNLQTDVTKTTRETKEQMGRWHKKYGENENKELD